jgi:hypothetical protein
VLWSIVQELLAHGLQKRLVQLPKVVPQAATRGAVQQDSQGPNNPKAPQDDL